FFQAEDGIRDGHVTGVQTCALPILVSLGRSFALWTATSTSPARSARSISAVNTPFRPARDLITPAVSPRVVIILVSTATLECTRSEERRVGKGCRKRMVRNALQKKR